MPDLSADRPLPLPEKIFSEEDIELVALAITNASGGVYDNTDGWARYVLEALAAAGRLLPPDAEHREELRHRWQVQYLDKAFAERHAAFYDDRTEADKALAMVRASPRYSEIKLLSKMSTPWVEVDENTEERSHG